VDPVGNKWVGTSLGLSILKDDITWEHYTTENSPLPAPTVESVAFNPITGQAFVGTTAGLSVLETTLIRPAVKMERLNVYPNPFHLSETGGATHLTIDGLARDAAVGIYTAQGNLVRKLSAASASGRILWDGRDQNGEYVPSGVYLVVAVDPAGKSVATKVAVLRK
jgi:flagellar hook assembly protein FlgD